MSFILGLFVGPFKLWLIGGIIAAATAFVGWQVHVQRDVGREEVRAEWSAHAAKQMATAMAEDARNARETARRINQQQENQIVQDQQLAAARRDAAANNAAADKLRDQLADTARRWRDALADSPAGSVCQAAGAAIVVSADLLGRANRASGELAEYADAARIAGLKCAQDYNALTPP